MEPIFNLDDPIGKTVGTRKPPRDSLSYALGLQKKERGDPQFLRMWFEARGITPPED